MQVLSHPETMKRSLAFLCRCVLYIQ